MSPEDPALEAHRQAVRARLAASGMRRPGPGSITWTINRERVVVAGWGRAILLQLAHPLVAAGVSDHSHFDRGLGSSVARLHSTVGAMLSLTFGDDDAAIATAAAINRIHDRVMGHLREQAGVFAAGTPYSAHQAELLRWVHLTLLESIPLTYELLIGPLTEADRDRYCAEAAIMEPLLDIPAGTLPRTWAEVGPAIASMIESGQIARTTGSHALGRAVLYPKGSALFWPAFRPVRLITIGLLSPRLRDLYGFAWTERDARALRRWLRALRILRACVPTLVREWPAARQRRRSQDAAETAGLLQP